MSGTEISRSAGGDVAMLLRGETVPILDGVRGLAIALVMVHNLKLPEAARTFLPIDAVAFIGWTGVDLFFALSGLLITSILLRSKGSPGFYYNFYGRRFLRIFPLYYLALIVWALIPQLLVRDRAALESCVASQVWNWLYLSNAKLFLDGRWNFCSTNHFWSLAVEEQFYLLWPLVVGWASQKGLVRIIVLGLLLSNLSRIALVAFGFSGVAIYVGPITRLDPLLIGALLAIVLRSEWTVELRRQIRLAFGAALLAGAGIAIVGKVVVGPSSISNTGSVAQVAGYPLVAIACGALLFLALTSSATSSFRRLLPNRALRFLGRHAYALYVVHPLLRQLIGPYITGITFLSIGSRQVLYLLFISATSIVASVLLWHGWEKWFLRLKRHFSYARPVPIEMSTTRLRQEQPT